MQFTNLVGPVATASNLLTESVFQLFTSSTFTMMRSPVNELLAAGTYHLVASATTPIPNSSGGLNVGYGEWVTFLPSSGAADGGRTIYFSRRSLDFPAYEYL